METSPCESERLRPGDLRIEPLPDAKTVAAITTAIRAYRQDVSSTETAVDAHDRQHEGWTFAARYEGTTNQAVRPRRSLPTNPWRAAERLDRI